MKFWYSKDEEKLNEYKYLIMLDLELNDLKKLAKKDKLVKKFMDNLIALNEDLVFREYMTVEEDRKKCYNSERSIGRKEAHIETAKKMLQEDLNIDIISKCTDLSIEKIEKLKKDLNTI